ncbi:MAG TPA: hypothetical protein VLK82_28695 [Candidatus Tectomicrobia bacterium]|nr:hypothetical protein [Candidatus Tectomicrobia bacterium]
MDQQDTHIRREIEYTRAAMSAKVAMIQERVEETVGETESTVVRTMNTVLEHVKQVQDMIENVTSTVDTTMERVQGAAHTSITDGQPAFELIAELYQRPWLMMGTAVLVGYILGSSRQPSSALDPASAKPASDVNPNSLTTAEPPGHRFTSPTESSVGPASTPTTQQLTDAAGPA